MTPAGGASGSPGAGKILVLRKMLGAETHPRPEGRFALPFLPFLPFLSIWAGAVRTAPAEQNTLPGRQEPHEIKRSSAHLPDRFRFARSSVPARSASLAILPWEGRLYAAVVDGQKIVILSTPLAGLAPAPTAR
jgi:hypothetical protein